jgi:hypothetical protein
MLIILLHEYGADPIVSALSVKYVPHHVIDSRLLAECSVPVRLQ